MKDSNIFKLYTLAELSYEKHFKDIVLNNDSLYPVGWYYNKNYSEKIEIIAEAIEKNILIINTMGYQNLIEGNVIKIAKE